MPSKPDTADHRVEELVCGIDLENFAVCCQEAQANDLPVEAAMLPAVLAVDVGANGAPETEECDSVGLEGRVSSR